MNGVFDMKVWGVSQRDGRREAEVPATRRHVLVANEL